MKDKLFPVGTYIDKFNTLTGQQLPCGTIYQSSGLIKHWEKRHKSEKNYISEIPNIINYPDYIGTNPNIGSIELVKELDKNVMVCIKLDTKNGYLFVQAYLK